MKYWIGIILVIAGISGCALNQEKGHFTRSSIQAVDMGKFKGLKNIEIATLNYPETTTPMQTSHVFTEMDIDNFSDSLIQSLKRSDVRVLPSAQTKVHIDFTQIVMLDEPTGTIITMVADVIVSRNGIVTRKTIEIKSKAKLTIGGTKDNGIKMFIYEIGELLREQSSFKR